MSYLIKKINSIEEIDEGEIALIDVYNWGGKYRPKTRAILCFIENEGFALKMMSKESKPTATLKFQNEMVCRDSCMEFFANFRPDLEGTGYINFEVNPNGACLCCYGDSVMNRKTVLEMGFKHVFPKPFRTEDAWGFTLFVPLKLISDIYGESEFKSGTKIRGNFFKCGDKTPNPHYGSYTEIKWEHPSFHRPEFFADMIIE